MRYRDGKRLGKKHGQEQRLRENKKRETANWRCPYCDTKYRGTEREVQRSRAVHVCPGTDLSDSLGGNPWHVS